MEYNFRDIEKKWQQKWVENKTYKVVEDKNKQKFMYSTCSLIRQERAFMWVIHWVI